VNKETGMNKAVIYTCLVGDYDYLFDPIVANPHVDYICFSNNSHIRCGVWQIRPLPESIKDEDSKINRYFKFFPHEFLPEYDISLYIDSNIRILSDLQNLIEDFYTSPALMALTKHPTSTSLSQEVELCLSFNKFKNPQQAVGQLEAYKQEGFPETQEMTQNNIIFRKHNDPHVIRVMEDWWGHINTYTARDQLSLPYLRWKHDIPVDIFPWNSSMENPYLRAYYHKGQSIWTKMRAYLNARQYEGIFYRVLLKYAAKIYRKKINI